MFRKEDIVQIERRGASVKTVEEQVERFKKGFPWLKIRSEEHTSELQSQR